MPAPPPRSIAAPPSSPYAPIEGEARSTLAAIIAAGEARLRAAARVDLDDVDRGVAA